MSKNQRWFRMVIPALFITSSCSSIGGSPFDPHYMSTDTTTPTTPPIGDTSAGSDLLGMAIGMKQAPNNSYVYNFHKAAESWTTACRITKESSISDRDILCNMEAKELDLAFNGVTLKLNVPPDMCSYVGFDPYFFYNYQAGQGPDFLTYDVNENGNVIAGSVVAKYGGPSGIDASSVVLFAQNTPTCIYDYTDDDGPNCCYGKYSGTIRTRNAASGSFESSPIRAEWAGEASNCLAGPAVEVNAGKNVHGFPLGFVYYTEGVGLNTEYPIESLLGKYGSSVGAANHFVPSDYPLNNPNMPSAFLAPLGDPALDRTVFRPNPYYTLLCFDRTMEIKARIRLLIQDWNVDSEFEKKGAANADPDTVGVEENFPEHNKNDKLDWKDFGYNFPQKAL